MVSMFSIILEMLSAAFISFVTKEDRQDIMRCIQEYISVREPRAVEQELQMAKGWSDSFDISTADFRYNMKFGPHKNMEVRDAINMWDRTRAGMSIDQLPV